VREFWNGDIPWVTPKDMKTSTIASSEETITESGLQSSAASWTRSGTVLLVVRSGVLKHTIPVAINVVPVSLNQDMKAILVDPGVCLPAYLLRLVQGNNDILLKLWTKQGATVESIEHGYLASTVLPLPTLTEQAAIAAFLDREVSKIDTLVAEQELLIELLKEKRQAVISQAVTKGLDPDASMKDSGVERLGEVPSHWTIVPLKWLTDPDRPIMYGIVLPGPDVGEGVPILKGGNVKPSRMNLDAMARTTPEIEAPYARARLKGGDLVYSIRGSIGDCEFVPVELEGSNITQDVARVAIDERFCAAWARWALLSSAIRADLACGSLGAAVRGINIFDLKRVKLPAPPLAEQMAIAMFIDEQTVQLESLATEAEHTIALLKERRTALISAAVTGKIDVRFVVPDVLEAA
jgi:type I restriction enzyme, S subunit